MYFENLLTNMQSMFTGFEKRYELLTEAHNIRLLFQNFHSPNLTKLNSALQISYDLYQDKVITFDFIANIMLFEAVNLP